MCVSMADIQSAAAEIRREKRRRRRKKKKSQGKNIMVCPIPYGDHNKANINYLSFYHNHTIYKRIRRFRRCVCQNKLCTAKTHVRASASVPLSSAVRLCGNLRWGNAFHHKLEARDGKSLCPMAL